MAVPELRHVYSIDQFDSGASQARTVARVTALPPATNDRDLIAARPGGEDGEQRQRQRQWLASLDRGFELTEVKTEDSTTQHHSTTAPQHHTAASHRRGERC